MKIHLVVPMGGEGSRFAQGGFSVPKPLIEIKGKPFFYWAAQSVIKCAEVEDVIFAVLKKHIDIFQIDTAIKHFYPYAKIKVIPEVLPGALCTCLEAVRDLEDGMPVLFNDCDHIFCCRKLTKALNEKEDFDGALLTFQSSEPQFSYVRFSDQGKIIGTMEKKAVSHRAVCGAYVFRNVEVFRESAELYLQDCQYGEYFVSGVYNIMCNKGLEIKEYPTDFHIPFGTPEEYERAVESDQFKFLEGDTNGIY